MKLSTRSRYGLRMLVDIARTGQNESVPLQEIASRQDISVKYLEKIARMLKQAGYLSGKRGPNGGHRLLQSPETIHIGDLLMVLEGDLDLVECHSGDSPCPRLDTCTTHVIWREMQELLYSKLNSITLAKLMNDGQECPHGLLI